MNRYVFTPRMRIHQKDGIWWLNAGYWVAEMPHDTWEQAARHARFIHRINTEP